VDINWDSAAVIDYFNAAISQKSYVDFSAMPGQGFID
jgi:hypothetical protein